MIKECCVGILLKHLKEFRMITGNSRESPSRRKKRERISKNPRNPKESLSILINPKRIPSIPENSKEPQVPHKNLKSISKNP